MRIDLFSLIETDAVSAVVNMSSDDLAYPVCVLAWAIILLIPLHGVDRRDPVTFVTYLTFILSAGIILFVIVPSMTLVRHTAYLRDILVIIIITAIVGIRWIIGNDKKRFTVRAWSAPKVNLDEGEKQ